jgi:nucleotide-binding universal stress UspA family protein
MPGSYVGEGPGLPSYRTIVVGTDGSETAHKALRHAVGLCRALGATLHVVAAGPGRASISLSLEANWPREEVGQHVEPRQELEAMLAGIAEEVRGLGVEVVTHAEVDVQPADAILDVAERHGADLIVVGNRGMTGLSRMLGSVPNAVSHRASCTVTIVRTS